MRIHFWKAETRRFVVEAVKLELGKDQFRTQVLLNKAPETPDMMDVETARQLAHTLLAAADVADEEARRDG